MFQHLRKWFGLGRKQAETATVTEAQWRGAEARLPFLAFLTPEERRRLRGLALVFLAEKQFHGAHGFPLTNEILLTIALQACLPVLHIGLAAYRGWVGVIVYPGDFVIPRQEMDEDGVVHEYDDEVLGEAWAGGPVLLSWFDDDAAPEGVNTVIHEFAHKLDMSNGEADGFPALPAGLSRTDWAAAFGAAYETFRAQVDAGEDTVLDPYGAEHPGEFFAVASEAFFETPLALQQAFPAVYGQLRRYYGADPAAGERSLMAAVQAT